MALYLHDLSIVLFLFLIQGELVITDLKNKFNLYEVKKVQYKNYAFKNLIKSCFNIHSILTITVHFIVS